MMAHVVFDEPSLTTHAGEEALAVQKPLYVVDHWSEVPIDGSSEVRVKLKGKDKSMEMTMHACRA